MVVVVRGGSRFERLPGPISRAAQAEGGYNRFNKIS
jgi:hypothetical protein